MATKKYVSLEKLGLYDEKIKKVISDGDAAALAAAKSYADGLATNYDAVGSAATEAGKVQAELDKEIARATAAEEANAKAAKQAQDEVDALELVVAEKADKTALDALAGKVGTVPEGKTVMGIITTIQENAYDDTQLRADMATELAKKADKTQVATDIETAVNAEKSARETAVAGVQSAVDTLSGTHATDKAALEGAIELKADKTALDAVSAVANAAVKQSDYDTKVAALEAEDARIAGLVAAEAERAAGVEAGLDERLEGVEAFFKLAEGEKLDEAKDTLIEIQKIIDEDAAAADVMLKDIAANKKAIEDHVATNHDFAGADAALKSELEGKINGKVAQGDFDTLSGKVTTAEGKITTLEGEMDAVEGKVSTLEGKMTTVEGAVATKAEAQALTDAVAALEGVDAGQETRIAALEAKFGEGDGNVAGMIATAKQEAIDVAAGDATTKANAAKDAAIAKANELNTAMDARVVALEAIDHDHSNKAELDLIATGDKAKWDAAAGKAHEHGNKTVIDGITSEKVTLWDTVSSKAAQSDLTAATDRITTLETWHDNFIECSEEDINVLFSK